MVVGSCTAEQRLVTILDSVVRTATAFCLRIIHYPCVPDIHNQGLRYLPYYAIGSLPKFLCYVVSLINNEVLVEDLEDFATLKVSHAVSPWTLSDPPENVIDKKNWACKEPDAVKRLANDAGSWD